MDTATGKLFTQYNLLPFTQYVSVFESLPIASGYHIIHMPFRLCCGKIKFKTKTVPVEWGMAFDEYLRLITSQL